MQFSGEATSANRTSFRGARRSTSPHRRQPVLFLFPSPSPSPISFPKHCRLLRVDVHAAQICAAYTFAVLSRPPHCSRKVGKRRDAVASDGNDSLLDIDTAFASYHGSYFPHPRSQRHRQRCSTCNTHVQQITPSRALRHIPPRSECQRCQDPRSAVEKCATLLRSISAFHATEQTFDAIRSHQDTPLNSRALHCLACFACVLPPAKRLSVYSGAQHTCSRTSISQARA